MATKYILDPSGNIKKVSQEDVLNKSGGIQFQGGQRLTEERLVNDTNKEYLNEVNQNTSNKEDNNSGEAFDSFLSNIQLGLLDGSGDAETFKNFITSKIDNDPSFGFRNPDDSSDNNFKQADENLDRSFKPFNSFTDTDRVFADEFEMLTGFRLRSDEFSESLSTGLLMFTYLAEVIAKIAAVEAIVIANQSFATFVSTSEYREPNTKLRLGKYDFTEYDIFTKYVFNVLNYPHESSNPFERIMAYFIGFTEWLSPDSSIDLNEIVKTNSDKDSFLEINLSKAGISKQRYKLQELTSILNILDITADTVLVTLASTLQNLIATGLNHTSINRVRLLLRKFYQERLFKSEVLYSAKQKDNYNFGFFDDLNYYYFKFIIERIQVGLPFLKKHFYNEGYYNFKQENPVTGRVSANRFTESYQIVSVDNYGIGGVWNSFPKGKTSTRITGIPQLLHSNTEFYSTLIMKNKAGRLDEEIEQNFVSSKNRKIPIETVNQLEEELESEYMPFYMHDLRTNEILSFHAFIESISDSFSPEYNSSSGFGRIDDVKSYVKTTRNINLTFVLAATSKTDHDMMWYQVNKIVSLVYPQWSNGYSADISEKKKFNNTDDSETFDLKYPFRYPFTQVPTASPLIRLRVGDVIKSNYSRTSLARLHGIGEEIPLQEFSQEDQNKFTSVNNRNKDLKKYRSKLVSLKNKLNKLKNQQTDLNKNSNLISSSEIQKELKEIENKIKKEYRDTIKILEKTYKEKVSNINEKLKKAQKNSDYLNSVKNGTYKFTPANPVYPQILLDEQRQIAAEMYGIDSKISISQKELEKFKSQLIKINKENQEYKDKIKKEYENKLFREKASLDNDVEKYNLESDIAYSKTTEFNIRGTSKNIQGAQTAIESIQSQNPYGDEQNKLQKEVKKELYNKVIDPEIGGKTNNPITISYESGMSRGLAGFITNLDVSYNDSTWEIEQGSRAPMLVKINIGFSPIHDIPPGLDHNGMLRAPTYNVGKINKAFFGDPNDRD